MKKNSSKRVVIVLFIICCIITTGCISKEKGIDESSNTKQAINKKMKRSDIKDGKIINEAVMLTVGEKNVAFSEVMVYVMLYKSDYDDILPKEIWNYNVEKNRNFEQVSKECIINQIVTSKIIQYGAEKIGVKVEPDEKIEIEDKAIECYNEVFKELNGKYGITQSVVKDVLYDNYLAEKVYEVATNEVEIDVKESEAKVPTVKQIYITFNGVNNEGKKIKNSVKTKEDAYNIIKSIKDRVNFDNFTKVAEEESHSDELEVKVTCDVKEKSYRKAALSLGKGMISDIIETANGYYILCCVDENDEEAMKDNEENIIKQRQEDIFAFEYSNWIKEYEIYIVSGLWNKMRLADV